MIENGLDLKVIQKIMEDRYMVHTDIYQQHNTFTGEDYYVLRFQTESFAIFISIRWSISANPKQFISVDYENLKTFQIRQNYWLFTKAEVIAELDKYLKPVTTQMSLF
jgi:hypothetical protein